MRPKLVPRMLIAELLPMVAKEILLGVIHSREMLARLLKKGKPFIWISSIKGNFISWKA